MIDQRGVALIDAVAASALCLILMAMAVPVVGGTLERERTVVGVRFIAGQLQRARLDALRRSQSVAVRFETIGEQTWMRLFVDGNGNGVLQKDVDKGVDVPLAPANRIDEQARDVSLRINQTIRDVSGSSTLQPGDDPLRIGTSSFVTFTPLGTATNGTLYISAPRGPQMAVRIFGATSRIRVLMFDAPTRQWLQ